MALDLRTPGVFVEEVSTLPASVAAVETAIPAFIGHTEKADKDIPGDAALTNVPTRITSMVEYELLFGGPNKEQFDVTITDTYEGTTNNDKLLNRSIVAALSSSAPSAYKMHYSVQMYFANGGGPCYIASTGNFATAVAVGTETPQVGLLGGLNSVEKVDEPTLLVYPDQMTIGNFATVYDASLAQCEKLKDRFVIMDIKAETGDPFADANTFRNSGVGADNLKYGAVYYPSLSSVLSFAIDEATSLIAHNNVGGIAPGPNQGALDTNAIGTLAPGTPVTADPALHTSIIAEINKVTVDIAPSGAIAGVYARVDTDRGVWKAPANVGVRAVSGPTITVTDDTQKTLNVDATSGKSVNAIRSFTGKGVLVWGSRTLAGNDNEWRYVPVRRLFIFAEESIQKATEFVVFEPNDANTWLRVKTMIENFLTTLWRQGALAGAKPEDAFFVNVGLGETMSPQDILEGRMIIEIGMAAVRPAEFIILRFSHKLQES